MNDSKDFRDVSRFAVEIHTLPVHLDYSLGHLPFEGLLKPAFIISQRQTKEPPNIRDTSGKSGNVFAHPQTSLSAPYPQEFNSTWRKTIEEPIHMSTAEKSGRPERDQDLRCQSGPSAKDSVIFSGGDSSKNFGADQQRLQISDLHFDKFPTPATFACWKIRFKTEVCTCSQFPLEALLWINEVEMVESVDLQSSCSVTRLWMSNLEVLAAKIASSLSILQRPLFGSLIGVSSVHSCAVSAVRCQFFFRYLSNSSEDGQQEFVPLPTYPSRCHSPRFSQFLSCESRDTRSHWKRSCIPSFFDTSLSRVMGYGMLFLCVGFAVPSTVGSLFLDDVVRDGESIQSPLTKILIGFTYNQEMSTSAIDHSLILLDKASHNSNSSTLPMSRIIAFESSLCGLWTFANRLELLVDEDDSRSSSRVREHRSYCLVHNFMWQSRHSQLSLFLRTM